MMDGLRIALARSKHGEVSQNLEKMRLNHVTDNAHVIEIIGTAFNVFFFECGNLDIAHIIPMHERGQNGVCITQREQIADRFLAQIMIEQINLIGLKTSLQHFFEFFCAAEICSERFFNHQTKRCLFRIEIH
ncbi:MAG: hypothetical protein ACD_28C00022G0001, partial [uncultured bacterium]